MKRGQASVEYLLVVAFFMAALMGGFYFYFIFSERSVSDIQDSRVSTVGNELAKTIDTVYNSAGYSIRTVNLQMPDNIKDIYIENRTLVIYYQENGPHHVLFPIHSVATTNIKKDDLAGGRFVIKLQNNNVLVCSGTDCNCIANEILICDKQDNDCDGEIDEGC